MALPATDRRWLSILTEICKFYEGAVGYSESKAMPYAEIHALQHEARRINQDTERAIGGR